MAIKITLVPNGPILLKAEGEDYPNLQTGDGGSLAVEKPTGLCRCGASANKPFCDGAHAGCDYSDENHCQNDELKDFQAPGVTVHFNRSICSGAAACVRNLPDVFKSDGEDWIQPGNASVEDVIETVRRCPSGALTFTLDGKTEMKQESGISVRIVPNGPYEIKGPVEFDAPRWSRNASKTNFALCRCGMSKNAPFCDYTHGEEGWDDSK
jgi:CDGSH-type Zn-finger protein/ferredoxin